jgi:MFS family permease
LLAGQALGPFAGGAIAAATSWRTAQIVAGGAALILAAVLAGSLARDRHRTPHTMSAEAPAGTPAGTDRRHAATAAPRGALGVGRGALLFISFAMFFTLGAMPQTLIPLIGDADLGLPVQWIGAALGVGGVCRLVGGFAGGVLSDRVSRRAALLPGLVLQALGVMLVAGAGVPWWLAGIVMMSLASWSISVAATVLADLAPEGRLGPQLGGFRFVGDVGLILGPLLATQLYELSGRAVTVTAIAALLVAAAVWCAISVPETAAPTR